MRASGRKRDSKLRTVSHPAFYLDRTAVFPGDLLCDRQTQAGPLSHFLGGKERIKKAALNPPEKYPVRYDGFSVRYNKAEKRCEALKRRKVTLMFEVDMIECFMTEICLMPELPTGFSESHWNALIDHVTVYADDRMVFTFKNGSEITENI